MATPERTADGLTPEERTEESWKHGYLEGRRHAFKEAEGRSVSNPLLIVERIEDNSVNTRIYPSGLTHEHFGMLLCDLVRHVANAFRVSEDDVWEWVDKERYDHTTEIRRPS